VNQRTSVQVADAANANPRERRPPLHAHAAAGVRCARGAIRR
jgi:hypothetical protein